MEKYNVVDTNLEAGGGEYGGQDGFGWTNGVLLKLINKWFAEGVVWSLLFEVCCWVSEIEVFN